MLAGGTIVEAATLCTRPTPKQSEIDAQANNAGSLPQVSFKNGIQVNYGTAGSSRPDLIIPSTPATKTTPATPMVSIEVKNYNIQNNSSGLIKNVVTQYNQRVNNLPAGTQQIVNIDIRGQNVSAAQQFQIKQSIIQNTNGEMKVEFIIK